MHNPYHTDPKFDQDRRPVSPTHNHDHSEFSPFDSVASTWESADKVARAEKFAALVLDRTDTSARKVLDYGCGTGILGITLAKAGKEVVLADASAGMIAEAKKKLDSLVNMDLTAVQLDLSGSQPSFDIPKVDVVVSSMVFHHIKETSQTLKNLRSILRPNGQLFIFDFDLDHGFMHQDFPQFDGHDGFSRPKFTAICEAVGFEVKSIETVHEMSVTRDDKTREMTIFLLQARAI